MPKESMPSLPYTNIDNCIALICNGEMELVDVLTEKIKRCSVVIGVDGGLNHLAKMNYSPSYAIGDFDSVDANILGAMRKNVQIQFEKTDRAKDYTDTEAGIIKAKEISKKAQIIIFAGLGGRLDHALSNIFLLLRDPGTLFLETEYQILFAVNASMGTVKIAHPEYKTLALFPLYGSVGNVTIGSSFYEKIDKDLLLCNFSNECSLSIGKGEVIVCLDKRTQLSASEFSAPLINTTFSIERPLINIFNLLLYQLKNPTVILASEKEEIRLIQPENGTVKFISEIGKIISLIPFNGPARNMITQGLKWELGKSLSELNKDFVGISNVSTGDTFSVRVGVGKLLCIVNQLIDKELVNANIN